MMSDFPLQSKRHFVAVKAALSIFAVACFLSTVPGFAQLDELTEDEAILRGMLTRAELKFSGGLLHESLLDFRKVINLTQQFSTTRKLTPKEQEVLVRAFFLRGQVYVAIGEQLRAREDFAAALRLDSGMKPDASASPKIEALLEEVKKEELGTLFIDSEPSSAEVYLEEKRIGLTPLFAVSAYKGVRDLEVRLQGYDTYSEKITILPDQQLQRNVALTRITGDIILYTQPSGARIYLDDKLIGTTSGSPSPEDCDRFGPAYDCGELSKALEINYVKPGIHTLRIEKPCYETRVENISVDAETREFEPFLLPDSRATLAVDSSVDGAKVYLGDEYLGTTPVELEGTVCSGNYRLLVKKTGVGSWFSEVSLIKGRKTEIFAALRPTLAFAGLVQHADRNLMASVAGRLRKGLSEVQTLNLLWPPAEDVQNALTAAGFSSLRDLAVGKIDANRSEILANQLETVCQKLDCDLLLFGIFPQQRLQTSIHLYLYLRGHGYPDVVPVEFQSSAKVAKFFKDLDHGLVLSKSWVGLLAVDRLYGQGCGVIRVSEGGPAKEAGIWAGNTILEVNDKPIPNNRSLRKLIAESEAGRSLTLLVDARGQKKKIDLQIDKTPVEIPKNNPDLLYNKLLADLQLMSKLTSSNFEKNFIQLNMALAYMRFKNWQKAVDTLGRLRFETKSGITNGTVYYYMAECLKALGYSSEARDNYQKALSYENATVGTNDGDLVKRLAEKKLKELL